MISWNGQRLICRCFALILAMRVWNEWVAACHLMFFVDINVKLELN